MNLTDQIAVNRAAELSRTVNSNGWRIVLEIAESLVKDAQAELMACDDETQLVRLQRKAQAAREFWTNLQSRIRSTCHVEVSKAEDFVPVSM